MSFLNKVSAEMVKGLAKCKKASPLIFVGLGVGGFILTAIETGRSTMKAHKAIVRAENEKAETLTNIEKVRVAAPYFIEPVIIGVASTACVLNSTRICYKRQAALMTACTVAETRFKEYYDKTKEIMGEKKAKNISAEINKEKIANDNAQNYGLQVPTGELIAHDYMFGRTFITNPNKIRAANNRINAMLLRNGAEDYISLNEVWDEMGVNSGGERPDIGNALGWNTIDLGRDGIEIEFGYNKDENDMPMMYVNYNPPPRFEFDQYSEY